MVRNHLSALYNSKEEVKGLSMHIKGRLSHQKRSCKNLDVDTSHRL